MKCPNACETPLVMSERHGVEIDYCPTCRGVWLDRGELDKIIERATPYDTEPARAAAPAPRPQSVTVPDGGRPSPYEGDGRRRKKSFLSEVFDF